MAQKFPCRGVGGGTGLYRQEQHSQFALLIEVEDTILEIVHLT